MLYVPIMSIMPMSLMAARKICGVCGRLKVKIADSAGHYPFETDIRIQKDVDRELYGREYVVTSDSIILDHCRSWVNLTGEYLRRVSRTPFQVWEQG